MRETLRTTLTWAMKQATDPEWNAERIVAHLGLA
jgi:hypothetical protein